MKLKLHKRRISRQRTLLMCAPLLAVLVTGSGCDTLFEQSDDASATSAYPGADLDRKASKEGSQQVAAYVNFVNVLDSTDEEGWRIIFEHTLDTYREDPTRERRLRLALAMSRADQKSAEERVTSNLLSDSRELLADTLNDPEPMPPVLRKFIQLQLTEVDTRLALYEEMRSLRAQLAKAHQESQTAQRDRSEAEARIRRIDAALTEANAKLEAVMNIERNITPPGKETFP